VNDPLHSLSLNRDKPMQIEAAKREARDQDMVVTFTGNVRVVLGDSTIRCESLTVYYEQKDTGSGIKAAEPGPGGAQQIRKLDATGAVIVAHRNQVATGDSGVFDMTANLATLTGNVVVTLGQDVLRGGRLLANLTTGVSRMEPRRTSPQRY
jgi:lipopolysaccharide export system protein LptA